MSRCPDWCSSHDDALGLHQGGPDFAEGVTVQLLQGKRSKPVLYVHSLRLPVAEGRPLAALLTLLGHSALARVIVRVTAGAE
jgi:hypothetical protein